MFGVAKTKAVVAIVEIEFVRRGAASEAAPRRRLEWQVWIGDERLRAKVQRRREAGDTHADFQNQDADNGDDARGGERRPA